jgi:hypothetical protein
VRKWENNYATFSFFLASTNTVAIPKGKPLVYLWDRQASPQTWSLLRKRPLCRHENRARLWTTFIFKHAQLMISSTYLYIDVLPTTNLHDLTISYYAVSSINLIGYKMLKCSSLLTANFNLKSGKGTYHFSCNTTFIIQQIFFWIKPLFLLHYASYITVTGNLQFFC